MENIFGNLTKGLKFSKKTNNRGMNMFLMKNGGTNIIANKDVTRINKNSSSIETDNLDNNDTSRSSESDDESLTTNGFESTEVLNAFRNRLNIKVKGSNVPNPITSFHEMKSIDEKNNYDKNNNGIKQILVENIENSEWKEPTSIQMQAIPTLLNKRDILASAPTGSGKTGAFMIPMIYQLESYTNAYKSSSSPSSSLRGLVLAPTKELAEQIHRETLRLSSGRKLKISVLNKHISSNALSAGKIKSVLYKTDLLISTPLRLLVLLRANAIDLSSIKHLVMDEADKLFELDGKDSESKNEGDGSSNNDNRSRTSFLRQVDEILTACTHSELQSALFSATLGPLVKELAQAVLKDPVMISVGRIDAGASSIDQKLMFTGNEEGKLLALRQLIRDGLRPPALIFLQNKDRAKALYKELVYDSISVDILHSDRTPQQRNEIVRQFRVGEIWILICTDLVARGIDFKGIQMVINYDLPESTVSYIHRIGRTGRAGRQGTSMTLFTEKDLPYIRSIANVVKQSGCEVQDWMLAIKPLSTKDKRQLKRKGGPDRDLRGTTTRTKIDKQKESKKKNIIRMSKAKTNTSTNKSQ